MLRNFMKLTTTTIFIAFYMFISSIPAYANWPMVQFVGFSMVDASYPLAIPATSYQSPAGIFSYQVKKGDTVMAIGRAYDVDPTLLAAINDLQNANKIKVGQILKVPIIDEIKHKVSQGETIWEIAKLYNVSLETIMRTNELWLPELIYTGQDLAIPGVKAQVAITKGSKVSSRSKQDKLVWPTEGSLSSGYGYRHGEFHTGIDLANDPGTPILAAAQGWVTLVENYGNYGKHIILTHLDGKKTLYAHNSKILVEQEQWVDQGETIALMGNTGRSTGPHLHFEVIVNEKTVNPLMYLK